MGFFTRKKSKFPAGELGRAWMEAAAEFNRSSHEDEIYHFDPMGSYTGTPDFPSNDPTPVQDADDL